MSDFPNNFGPRETNITIRQTYDNELQIQSVKYYCSNCTNELFTRVNSKISSNGIVWAICCCCVGFWPLIFCVFCADGFRQFEHYCSSCNALLGTYETGFSGAMSLFIAIAVLAVIGLWAFIICAYAGVFY